MTSPEVARNRSDSRATPALAAGAKSLLSQPSGARSFQLFSNASAPGMLRIAIDFSGPAETRLTRIPRGPSCRARYRVADSRPALATPIQEYAGHATVA